MPAMQGLVGQARWCHAASAPRDTVEANKLLLTHSYEPPSCAEAVGSGYPDLALSTAT